MTETSGQEDFIGTATSDFARETWVNVAATHSSYIDPALIEAFRLGPFSVISLLEDPKRFVFQLSRHKFVSKMLAGRSKVLEIGCHEGIGTLLVAKTVKEIVAFDFYRPHVDWCRDNMAPYMPNVTFMGHDMIAGPVPGGFDAAFALDVIEHIDPAQEGLFLRNICDSLTPDGVFLCGLPSLESQAYASPASRAGHINCKSGEAMRRTCLTYFDNVFMFGMNDEVVHTGYFPMCQYIFALCTGPKPTA